VFRVRRDVEVLKCGGFGINDETDKTVVDIGAKTVSPQEELFVVSFRALKLHYGFV